MLSVQTTKLPRHQAGRLQLLLQKQQQEHTMYGIKLLVIMGLRILNLFA